VINTTGCRLVLDNTLKYSFLNRKISILAVAIVFFALPSIFASAGFTSTPIKIVTTIPVGDSPNQIAYDPSNKYIYVLNQFTDYPGRNATISIINSATNTVVKTVKLDVSNGGSLIHEIVYVPSSHEIYAAVSNINDQTNNVYVLKGTSLIANINLGMTLCNGQTECVLGQVAYNPSNGYVYVALSLGLVVINGMSNKIVKTLPLPGCSKATKDGLDCFTYGVIYNPSNQEMYVSNSQGNFVSAIRGTTILATLSPLLGRPLAYDPANHNVYALNGTTVVVINSSDNKILASISIGSDAETISYDPANGNMYTITNEGLSMINSSNNSVAKVGAGSTFTHQGMSFNTSNKYLYVTIVNSSGYYVNVYNAKNSQVASLYIGPSGASVSLYDPCNSDVYVIGSNTVYVVS
jgi:DNA-binding beta-propeller fold protein YncE